MIREKLRCEYGRLGLALLAVCWCATCYALESPEHGSHPGDDSFVFSNWAGPRIPVLIYAPVASDARTPIVFIMHGTNRDPDRYRNEWRDYADDNGFIIVAPEFSRANFPGARSYNLGGVIDKDGHPTPSERWAYSAIEAVFDAVRKRLGSEQVDYAIYGHSAGAQFVHRFLYFVPNARVSLAIAANAGWYTMPVFDREYPYGLAGAPVTTENLRDALGQRLVVLLGTRDTDPNHKSLRRTPEAMEQGPHRYARGNTFFESGAREAAASSWHFGWQLEYAPEIGHQNGRMAAFAAPLLVQANAVTSSATDE